MGTSESNQTRAVASEPNAVARRFRVARAELRMAAAKFGAIANNRHPDRERLENAEAALERAADAFAAAKHEHAAVVALDGTVQR